MLSLSPMNFCFLGLPTQPNATPLQTSLESFRLLQQQLYSGQHLHNRNFPGLFASQRTVSLRNPLTPDHSSNTVPDTPSPSVVQESNVAHSRLIRSDPADLHIRQRNVNNVPSNETPSTSTEQPSTSSQEPDTKPTGLNLSPTLPSFPSVGGHFSKMPAEREKMLKERRAAFIKFAKDRYLRDNPDTKQSSSTDTPPDTPTDEPSPSTLGSFPLLNIRNLFQQTGSRAAETTSSTHPRRRQSTGDQPAMFEDETD